MSYFAVLVCKYYIKIIGIADYIMLMSLDVSLQMEGRNDAADIASIILEQWQMEGDKTSKL